MATQLYYPLPREQVSEWPGDRGGYWHYGTDFAVPVDTPLPACFDGVIVFAGGDGARGQYAPGIWANGEGLTVDILRSDGLRARYGHLNRIDVKVGQRVTAGQQIGLSGNTGFTTGPHCHWELRWDALWSGGAWADPRTLGAIDFPPVTPPRDKRKPVEYITLDTNKRKTKQTLKPREARYLMHTSEGGTAVTSAPGDYQIAAEVLVKGDPGVTVRLDCRRYKWDGAKYTSEVFINGSDVTIGKSGWGATTFPIANRVPDDGSRLGVKATVTSGKKSVTVERFAVKGHRWEQ